MVAKVAAVAGEEPQMALKAVAAATVPMARPPRDMAHEFIARIV